MVNEDGESISYDCESCHIIIAQGASTDLNELETNLTGLEFVHPEDIDEMWREAKCTDCHDSESGY